MNANNKQTGAALVIGLVLLMVLTVLAISTMSTAGLELTMAGNNQYADTAFQMAESAIDSTIGDVRANNQAVTTTPGWMDIRPDYQSPENSETGYSATITYRGTGPVPAAGYSIGSGDTFLANHFEVRAQGRSSRGAETENLQGFWLPSSKGAGE